MLFGPQGERWLDLEKLYRIPQKEGEREHDLRPGEVLTEVLLPPAAGRKVASYEVRQRETLDWSLATAAVALEMEGGKVARARVILGQVAPVPWAATEAEELLKGKTLDAGAGGEGGGGGGGEGQGPLPEPVQDSARAGGREAGPARRRGHHGRGGLSMEPASEFIRRKRRRRRSAAFTCAGRGCTWTSSPIPRSPTCATACSGAATP